MRTFASQRRACALAAAGLMAMMAATTAQAAGLPDPGDYAPAPAGATVLAFYAQQMRADKLYDGGNKVVDGMGLKMDVAVLRAMHYFQLGGMPADVEVILPMARQRISSMGFRESGVGNLSVGATIWPYSDDATGHHWGIASYLSMPTGQHRDQGFAISEDRYAWDIETGYIMPLGKQWSLDLIGQLEFYGKDRTTSIKRKPMLTGIAHLSYQLNDQTSFAFSVRHTTGKRETLHGATLTGSSSDTNLMLTWQQWLGEASQLQLQYQRDVRVRNNVSAHGVQLRLVQVF